MNCSCPILFYTLQSRTAIHLINPRQAMRGTTQSAESC